MNRTDISLLGNQLNALAETFNAKPVSVKAMEVWFEALRDQPTEIVMDVVNHWARRHGRFPTPAQVWESANEIGIDRREAKAASERKQNAAANPTAYFAPTQEGRAICARLRKMLGTKTPSGAIERIPGEDDELEQRLLDAAQP